MIEAVKSIYKKIFPCLCPMCNSRFSSKERLQNHMLIHHNSKRSDTIVERDK